jgi:hypothetical protein
MEVECERVRNVLVARDERRGPEPEPNKQQDEKVRTVVVVAERKREVQVLRKKNQELTSMTRKLEEKVKSLEKVSRE